MNHYLINIALIYFISAAITTAFAVYILKINFLGKFWGALAVGLVGSFVGGTLGSMLPVIFNRVLQSFIPAIVFTAFFLYLFRWLSILQDY